MSVDRLRDLLNKTKADQPGYDPDPSWRRYLADPARPPIDDAEFRPESEKPRPSLARKALTGALTAVVAVLLVIVSREAVPLVESLPNPIEQFQAVLAEFHLESPDTNKKINSIVVAVPKKRRGGHPVSEPVGDEPLAPYKGVIDAELDITPLSTVQPFKVQVADGHKRQNLEITAKPLIVDIDEPDQAVVRTAVHQDPLQPFALSVELTGPEADHIASVLTTGNSGVPARYIERHVGLLAVIDKNGKVTSIRRVNGSSALAQAAIDTARRSQFRQFYQNGKPVDMQTSISVSFTIPKS
ncbi:MAG: energy transducer TonB [Acidobacteria bacterium]|nr:energy transducer TonB [Acidobacteriaceae bacterium]MBV9610363.1 energy transducer TonB [Acidobacteriota bacterium]